MKFQGIMLSEKQPVPKDAATWMKFQGIMLSEKQPVPKG